MRETDGLEEWRFWAEQTARELDPVKLLEAASKLDRALEQQLSTSRGRGRGLSADKSLPGNS
jgi:hypothetical protein